MRTQYESEVRTKNTELEGHIKNGLKDSIRLSLQEIAAVHIKYGFTGNADSLGESVRELERRGRLKASLHSDH